MKRIITDSAKKQIKIQIYVADQHSENAIFDRYRNDFSETLKLLTA